MMTMMIILTDTVEKAVVMIMIETVNSVVPLV